MTRPRDLDPELIARYLSGQCTPAETVLMRLWTADPRHRAELDAMQRAWNHSFPIERPIDVDGAWRRVVGAMHAHAPPASRGLAPSASHAARASRPSHATHVAMLAAAAAVVFAVGVHVVRRTWTPVASPDAHVAGVPRTTSDFAALPGQRALIDLTDGTRIVLAPASHLHVSLPVGTAGVRELTLDGEALFTVTHDPARPFVVHSRFGTTVDIGTAFAVRAYAGEPYRVVVREGRVALSGSGGTVLVAGDVASRSDDGTMRVAHGKDAPDLLDWTTGRLTFQHARLADLIPDLERWCGVTIHIATPSLRNRIITGQLDAESPSEAMDAIGRTLGAQHTIHGTHVTFWVPGEGR